MILRLRPCFPPGFTEPTPHDVAGGLLPHLCTLTCAGIPAIGGMFLWHYPRGYPHWEFPQRCVLLKARTFLIPLSGGDSKDAIACPSSLFSSILLHLPNLENPGNRYKLHVIGNVGGHMQDLLVQIHHHSRYAFGAIPGGQMGIRMAADAVGGIRPVL